MIRAQTHMVALFVLALFFLLIFFCYQYADKDLRTTFVGIIVFSFVIRLMMGVFFTREYAFFSYDKKGGDSVWYQDLGEMVANMWMSSGVHWVDAAEMHDVAQIALVVNLFAMVNFICGEPTYFGCLSLVAFLACISCMMLYQMGVAMGAKPRHALTVMVLWLFSPGFLFHTSDTYKDGLNAFCVIAGLGASIQLSNKYSLKQVFVFAFFMLGLWHIRHYMVFMCMIPFIVAFMLSPSRTSTQKFAAYATLACLVVGIVFFQSKLFELMGVGVETYDEATADNARAYNAAGGSGVQISGNGPVAVVLRLVYTIFSPFPWQGGSFGLQMGKIDTTVWYYVLYRIYKGRKLLMRDYRRPTIVLATFLVPSFYAYSTTMSNIGLIFRQRMPLVMLATVLFSLVRRESRSEFIPATSRFSNDPQPLPI